MNIGFAEGLVIALIAVLLIKPEELRVAARTAGRWMREMRKMSNEFMSELQDLVGRKDNLPRSANIKPLKPIKSKAQVQN